MASTAKMEGAGRLLKHQSERLTPWKFPPRIEMEIFTTAETTSETAVHDNSFYP